MKEQLISFETAKLAKEKGYTGTPPYFGYVDKFYENNGTIRSYGMHRVKNIKELIHAPTQSLFQKWLREKHNIDITIKVGREKNIKVYYTHLSQLSHHYKEYNWSPCTSYEDALEAGLQTALKLINDEIATNIIS